MDKKFYSIFQAVRPSKIKSIVVFCSLAAITFFIVSVLLEFVTGLGRELFPVANNLVADYFLGFSWAVILGCSILFWPIPSEDKKALLWIWGVKTIVVLVIMLAYEYHYGFDIDGYFVNSREPNFIWTDFKFGNGTYAIAQLVWLHNKIMFESYYAAKIGFALIGLIGSYLFYRSANLFLGRREIRALYILSLFPSILLWSSILGKDPITFFGVALCVYSIVAWYRLQKLRYLIFFVLGSFVVAFIRIWLVPILVISFGLLIFVGVRSFIQRVGLVAICFLAFLVIFPKLQSMWSVSTIEGLFKFRAYATTAFIGGGSSIKPPEIANFFDLIRHLPASIFTALFRPLPGEVRNIFGFFQSLENIFLLGLLFLAIRRTKFRELKDPLIFWAISLVFIWASFYGLVTYNLGALVRYKLQILPVFLSLLLYFSRPRQA